MFSLIMLENRKVNTVIIGATGGIGQALARVMPHPQILVARDSRRLFALARELGTYAVPADVTHQLELMALAQEIKARGGIQTLFYAVGDIVVGTDLAPSIVERIWNANLLGFQYVCQYLGDLLLPSARVYAIGARPELVAFKGFEAYANAKAALSTYAREAEIALQRPVTVVLPPAVNTPFWARLELPVPKNAVEPEVIALGLFENLQQVPSPELRIG
jgi:NAD(P)-dependent dehydrogenase (short-subunit alcohol dehydrogenase family)